MHVSETQCLKSQVLFYPQYSARSSIVVYARGGVICAEGLHFSAFQFLASQPLIVYPPPCKNTIILPDMMHIAILVIHNIIAMYICIPSQVSQEHVYRISSLEGQLGLSHGKLTEAVSHHDQVLAAERHLRCLSIPLLCLTQFLLHQQIPLHCIYEHT